MATFKAQNDLEDGLVKARADRMWMPEFLSLLVSCDLIVPSSAEVLPDGSGLKPLLVERDKIEMVMCFTSQQRASIVTESAPYRLVMNGSAFLRRVPSQFGLALNPSHAAGFEMTPDELAALVSTLR